MVPRSLALAMSAAMLSGCALFQAAQPRQQAQVTLRVADAAMAAGEPEMALRVAGIVLRREPHSIPAMVAKANALYAMGSIDAARAAYRDAVAADPANADAQMGLGRTLVRSNPRAAEAAFLAAFAQQPDNVLALNDLGIARDMQGRHADAQKAYRMALAVSPDNADVRTNLRLSLALAGDGPQPADGIPPAASAPQPARAQRMPLAGAERMAISDEQVAPIAIDRAPVTPVRRESLPAPVRVAAVPRRAPEPAALPPFWYVNPSDVVADASAFAPTAALVPTAAASPVAEAKVLAVAPPAIAPPAIAPPAIAQHAIAQHAAAHPVPDPAAAAQPAPPSPENQPGGRYTVQMAAVDSAHSAFDAWNRMRARMPDVLAGHQPAIQQAAVNQRTYWRLRTGAFASAGAANDFCARLRAAGAGCWTVPPGRE